MTCSTGSCGSGPSPKCVAKLLLRIGFGGALALFGLAHYKTLDMFKGMVGEGLGPLSGLGTLWAYILPLLMIVGGILLIVNYRADIAAWCAGVALASIAIGMPLKAVVGSTPLPDVGQAVNNALLWLIVYFLVIKTLCCKGGSCSSGSCGTGGEHKEGATC